MSSEPEPVMLDLGDFDAVGVAAEVVVALRGHAIAASVDAAASVSAPAGWHGVVITARRSGHVVLGVRYGGLSSSRWNNVAEALERRGWQLDDDGAGATIRYPPGTEPTTVAFDILGVLVVSGAPADVRSVTAVDGRGAPVDLRPTND